MNATEQQDQSYYDSLPESYSPGQIAEMWRQADGEIDRLKAGMAELIEAARRVIRGRHSHRASDSPDGGESCGLCGHNWRNTGWHFMVGESQATDEARLDAAPPVGRDAPPAAVVSDAWLEKASALYDRCKLWPETSEDGLMACLELRNHVATILPALTDKGAA